MQYLRLSNCLDCLSNVRDKFAAIFQCIVYPFRDTRLTAHWGNVASCPAEVVEPPPVSGTTRDEVVCPRHFTVKIATIRIFDISSTMYGLYETYNAQLAEVSASSYQKMGQEQVVRTKRVQRYSAIARHILTSQYKDDMLTHAV